MSNQMSNLGSDLRLHLGSDVGLDPGSDLGLDLDNNKNGEDRTVLRKHKYEYVCEKSNLGIISFARLLGCHAWEICHHWGKRGLNTIWV